jgi:hypothetical protein
MVIEGLVSHTLVYPTAAEHAVTVQVPVVPGAV